MSTVIMSQPWLWKRGSTSAIDSYVGVKDEPVLDMRPTVPLLRMMDGVTPGGVILDSGIQTGIYPPTITTPVDGAVNVLEDGIIVASNILAVTPDVLKDVHAASYWEIATDVGFTAIVYSSGRDTVNLESIDLFKAGVSLANEITHYVRVKYEGVVTGVSQWSPVNTFTVKPIYPTAVADKLRARIPQDSALMGVCVDISDDGNTVITGSYDRDDVAGGSQGAAHIFIRNPLTNTWTENAMLLASDAIAGDRFGLGVAISGDGSKVAVSAQYASTAGIRTGAVYYFAYDAVNNVWVEEQKILTSDGAEGDHLGREELALSRDGNSLLLGASGKTGLVGTLQGSTYYFTRDPVTAVWTEQQIILPSDPGAGDRFGYHIWTDPLFQLAIIASPYADNNGFVDVGKAYIFANVAGVWTEQQIILPPVEADGHIFGYAGTIAEDLSMIVIAGVGNSSGIEESIYIYNLDAITGDYVLAQTMVTDYPGYNYNYGRSVDLSGDGNTLITATSSRSEVYTNRLINGTWTVVNTIIGNGTNGAFVAISADGTTVASGAYTDGYDGIYRPGTLNIYT